VKARQDTPFDPQIEERLHFCTLPVEGALQDVRLSRVPQLNLNFGGILMENKAFKEDGSPCRLPPGMGGTFVIRLAAFLHHYRVRQEIP
jgi:hypothetical protein